MVMPRRSFLAFLSPILVSCMILFQPAYADTLNDYQSASFLSKVPEVKVEAGLISLHAGNKVAIAYYENLLNRYWTSNDTGELAKRDPRLADLVSSLINDTIAQALAGNESRAGTDFFDLAGYMEQAGVVRVDPSTSQNATIQAMAISMVLKESLERYGDAINSPQLASISVTMNSPVQAGQFSSVKPEIVNEFAYENSKQLANEAVQMYGQFITHYENGPYNDKITYLMTKYTADLDSMADPNTLVQDVIGGIYPDFVSGYKINLESIPEFPTPLLVAITTISAAVIVTRLGLRRVFL